MWCARDDIGRCGVFWICYFPLHSVIKGKWEAVFSTLYQKLNVDIIKIYMYVYYKDIFTPFDPAVSRLGFDFIFNNNLFQVNTTIVLNVESIAQF